MRLHCLQCGDRVLLPEEFLSELANNQPPMTFELAILSAVSRGRPNVNNRAFCGVLEFISSSDSSVVDPDAHPVIVPDWVSVHINHCTGMVFSDD